MNTQIKGTDIHVIFTVVDCGKVKDMSGATDLKWAVKLEGFPMRKSLPVEVSADSTNPYSLTVRTTSKDATGAYIVSLDFNEADGRHVRVAAPAFRLSDALPDCGCNITPACYCAVVATTDTAGGENTPAFIPRLKMSVPPTYMNIMNDAIYTTPEYLDDALEYVHLNGAYYPVSNKIRVRIEGDLPQGARVRLMRFANTRARAAVPDEETGETSVRHVVYTGLHRYLGSDPSNGVIYLNDSESGPQNDNIRLLAREELGENARMYFPILFGLKNIGGDMYQLVGRGREYSYRDLVAAKFIAKPMEENPEIWDTIHINIGRNQQRAHVSGRQNMVLKYLGLVIEDENGSPLSNVMPLFLSCSFSAYTKFSFDPLRVYGRER